MVSAIMTDDIPRKFLSDHMFLTSSFMVYRKIKNCDKFGMTKSDKQRPKKEKEFDHNKLVSEFTTFLFFFTLSSGVLNV
jgi:hypothetical protein